MRGLSVTQFVTVLCSTAAVANTHTHSIRQSVCFVTIAGSFVRAIKRVSCSFLFYFYFLDFLFTNHSILRVWMYINVSTFFPPLPISSFVGPVVGIKRTCEDWSPKRSRQRANTKGTWSNSMQQTQQQRPHGWKYWFWQNSIKKNNHHLHWIRLINRKFFFFFFLK